MNTHSQPTTKSIPSDVDGDGESSARSESGGAKKFMAVQWTAIGVAMLGLIVSMDVGRSSEFAALFCLVIGAFCIVLGLTIYANRQPTSGRAVRNGESGSAMVEFALGYSLVLLLLLGTIGFGLTFFRYNQLQSSIRGAARFASLHPYDLPNGVNWKSAVRNMAVFGDPAPPSGSQPLISGLATSHINVTAALPLGVPETVTVAAQNFTVNSVVRNFTISKPIVTFPYLGRVVVN